jgi:methanethiol S-methyltransferase
MTEAMKSADRAAPAGPAAAASQPPPSPAYRSPAAVLILGYAAAVYVFFLALLVYSAGFFIGVGVPKGIDDGTRSAWPLAVIIDAGLLLLFAVQHTVMARSWFKRRWTRLVPQPAERATYVLAASLVLALVFWLWRPLSGTAWDLSGPIAAVLFAVYAAGWGVALSSTFIISHTDLFGLRQALCYARGTAYRPPAFTQRSLYRVVRHPLMTGFVIIFWATPTMSAGHLLFAAAATGYILVGIVFEEHDLRQQLGEVYHAYAARVPALIPRFRPASEGDQ